MNKSSYNRIIQLFGIMPLLVLSSCIQFSQPDNQRNTMMTSKSATVPTKSRIVTISPVLNTPSATVAISATSIPTQTPTWTPSPTLSRRAAYALVQDLLENNGGCQLPCWWGITPGITNWDQARHFLETFVIEIKQNWKGTVIIDGVPVQQADYYITYEIERDVKSRIYVLVENGIVEETVIGGRGSQRSFRLHQLLTNYGPPSDVFIRAHRYTNDGSPPPFDFVLYYARNHFWAHFRLTGRLVGDKLEGCPQSIDPRIWVGAPDQEWTLVALFDYVFGPPIPGFPAYPTLTLKKATGMDLETFTNIFKDPDNQSCLETPADLWH